VKGETVLKSDIRKPLAVIHEIINCYVHEL